MGAKMNFPRSGFVKYFKRLVSAWSIWEVLR